MKQLFSIHDEDFLPPVDKKEKVLQDFLWDKREKLLQKYNFIFIDKEYPLNEGPVHDSDTTGRIDILAYNPAKERFVIFELKKDDGKLWGLYQAQKYRSYIKKHFAEVCLNVLKKYNVSTQKSTKYNKAEIILIAKEFTQTVIDEADEEENLITLIEYNWFGDDFLFLADVHESTPAAKPKSPKPIGGGGKPSRWMKKEEWQGIVTKSDEEFKKQLQAFPISSNKALCNLQKLFNQTPEKVTVGKCAALWERIVESFKPSDSKEKLQAIPYKKENALELRDIIEPKNSFNHSKRRALLYLLKQLEKQD